MKNIIKGIKKGQMWMFGAYSPPPKGYTQSTIPFEAVDIMQNQAVEIEELKNRIYILEMQLNKNLF